MILARCLALLVAATVPAAAVAVVVIPPGEAPQPRVAAVPPVKRAVGGVAEPGVWLLLGGGFVAAGLAARRRPSAPVVTS